MHLKRKLSVWLTNRRIQHFKHILQTPKPNKNLVFLYSQYPKYSLRLSTLNNQSKKGHNLQPIRASKGHNLQIIRGSKGHNQGGGGCVKFQMYWWG